MASASAFQAEDEGSIPFTRSRESESNLIIVFCFSYIKLG